MADAPVVEDEKLETEEPVSDETGLDGDGDGHEAAEEGKTSKDTAEGAEKKKGIDFRAEYFKEKQRTEKAVKERDTIGDVLAKATETLESISKRLDAGESGKKGAEKDEGGETGDGEKSDVDKWLAEFTTTAAEDTADQNASNGKKEPLDIKALVEQVQKAASETVKSELASAQKQIQVENELQEASDIFTAIGGEDAGKQAEIREDVRKMCVEKNVSVRDAVAVLHAPRLMALAKEQGINEGKTAAAKEYKVKAMQAGIGLDALGLGDGVVDPALEKGKAFADGLVAMSEEEQSLNL